VTSLRGKTIAITEARRAAELASLITKLGGTSYSAPAVREVPRQDLGPALDALERICRREAAAIIFLTGVGARAFLGLAGEAGKREALLEALRQMLVAARGPKPVAVLREAGVRIDLIPEEPTSEGLLAALAGHELRGRGVAVQLYGEENPLLVDALAARGATVLEIPLYEWALPEDQEPLIRLAHDLTGGLIDVLAITSAVQVKHLFLIAERLGLGESLVQALRGPVAVAVQGPVSAAALAARGIVPKIRSHRPTMGALIHAIADYFSRGENAQARS